MMVFVSRVRPCFCEGVVGGRKLSKSNKLDPWFLGAMKALTT